MLLTEVGSPFAIVADSAFPHTKAMRNVIFTPLKKNELRRLATARKAGRLTEAQFREKLAQSQQVTSCRQAAEWGMRSLQGTFSRLKTRLTHDARKRGRLIECCLRLFNLRVRRVGLVQTRTVYEQYWSDAVIANARFDRVHDWYARSIPRASLSASVSTSVSAAPRPEESKRSGRMRLIDAD